ncbi:unnamed protein product [Macrosiphum euphorbiae]|uniref:Uncharacterized protein n=1 Tax=Macrosiphum euphorbiae TaxID=13131 RepID=A0AAV0WSD4_9HEMI|nr:unnamed protein product [Macrosiphum euphorbiae]
MASYARKNKGGNPSGNTQVNSEPRTTEIPQSPVGKPSRMEGNLLGDSKQILLESNRTETANYTRNCHIRACTKW